MTDQQNRIKTMIDDQQDRVKSKIIDMAAALRTERQKRVDAEARANQFEYCLLLNFKEPATWKDFEDKAIAKFGHGWRRPFVNQCQVSYTRFRLWEMKNSVPGHYYALINGLEAENDSHPYDEQAMVRALFKITKGVLPTRGRKSPGQDTYTKIATKMQKTLPERNWTSDRVMSLAKTPEWRAIIK